MHRPLLLALALAAAPALAQPVKGAQAAPPDAGAEPGAPTKQFFPFPTEVHSLPNGLRVVFVPYDSPGLVAYYTLVRTGSRNEVEPGRSGFAHFFEHMMFRGTERYPKDAYDQLLSRAGVSNNAFTTDDFTCYTVFGPSQALPTVVELEADRFQNLKYSRQDFQTEAKAVLGEYNKNFSNPSRKMEEVMRDVAFTAHTYKHTTMGFKEDVEAMPSMYDYSLEFFQRWYTPDNTTILVVGDFDRQALGELIERHYGTWKGKASDIAIPKEPKQTKAKSAHVAWDSPTQPRLMMGWHTPEIRVDDNAAAIQNVLGPYLFGPTSPTFRDLVLERQLLTDLGVRYWDHRDPSLFYLQASLKDPKSFAEVQKALEAAVAELRSGKVDEKRLADIKSNQKYGLLLSFDNAPAVALQLAFAIGPTGDVDALNALFNHMEKLTPQDLVGFANAFLVEPNRTVITLTGPGHQAPKGAKPYVPSKRPGVGAKKGEKKAAKDSKAGGAK